MPPRTKSSPTDSTANLGFEAKLWLSADTATRVSANPDCAATWRDLRAAQDHRSNNMDAAEYKHVVLGLIFLKYISDSFDEHHAKLVLGSTRASRVGIGAPADPLDQYAGANPEDKDEYLAANVFWVPKEARWAHLQAGAKRASIGKDVDDAMRGSSQPVAGGGTVSYWELSNRSI